MADLSNRRPLKSRESATAQGVARRLAATAITPNQISVAGIGFAAVAGGAFAFAQGWPLLLLAAWGCQMRLLCNLFDGMVAVEAGRASADGGFWNEFPDRVSDALILAGLGWGAGLPALGWAVVAGAMATAYLRELSVNLGQGADFAGPMAKQHRMALATAAALLACFEPLLGWQGVVLQAALWAMAAGLLLTIWRRARRLVLALRAA